MLYIYRKMEFLPLDLIHDKIGTYLLEDPNKTIHKIFENRKDDDLQILLFGEVKDLRYINIYDSNNEIEYEMNDKLKNYINFILKANKIKSNLKKMKCKFYIEQIKPMYFNHSLNKNRYKISDKLIFKIKFYDEIGDEIVELYDRYYYGSGFLHPKEEYETLINYRVYKVERAEKEKIKFYDKWKCQRIKKKDIINEYNEIKEEIMDKYF